MKTELNWKLFGVALIILLAGVVLMFFKNAVILSVGTSLIATGGVSILNALLVERNQHNPLKEWGIKKIYDKRTNKDEDSIPELEKAKSSVDIVAFGLSKFRSQHVAKVEELLRKGVDFRILTMKPTDNIFIRQREKEENATDGNIANQIIALAEWADKLNRKKYKGKISIRYYETMTLDFYWRIDDNIYVGPYLDGRDSGITITYKFHGKKSKGFKYYSSYFEELWNKCK